MNAVVFGDWLRDQETSPKKHPYSSSSSILISLLMISLRNVLNNVSFLAQAFQYPLMRG